MSIAIRFAAKPAHMQAQEDIEDDPNMLQAGFHWDPICGRARWTHARTGITALRQPYMTEVQWREHKVAKLRAARVLTGPR